MAGNPDVLSTVAGALNRAATVADVAAAIFERVAEGLGAGSVALWLVEERRQRLRLVGTAGFEGSSAQWTFEVAISDRVPAADVAKSGESVVFSSPSERDERWPMLADIPDVMPAGVAFPLEARGELFGVIGFGFLDARDVADDELAVLLAVSEHCALAMDRALLFDRERRTRETQEFLAEATRLMVSALEPSQVLERLIDAAVPRLADSCAVFVARDTRLEQVALRIRGVSDPAALGEVSFAIENDHPLSRAYRSGEPVVVDAIRDEEVDAVRPGRAAQARDYGIVGGFAVPLIARGNRIGVVSFAFTDVERFDDPDLVYAVTGFAARAAIALDNARRFDDERAALTMLSRALLPPVLPALEGYDLTGRYVAAVGDLGGDWYDAQLLPDGSLLLGVGDVAGHGVAAAAQMGELRHTARAIARWRRRPRVLLDELSRFAADTGTIFATVGYARIDLATGAGRWAAAGHPPAFHVQGGQVKPLAAPHGPPLGISDSPPYRESSVALGVGDMLALYTDGVIERRDEHLDRGLERLRALLAEMHDDPLEQVADAIVTQMCTKPADDCCLLLLRRRA
jgi:serine/threonine-protein kinase RsbW